jgi:cell division protein FtsQ
MDRPESFQPRNRSASRTGSTTRKPRPPSGSPRGAVSALKSAAKGRAASEKTEFRRLTQATRRRRATWGVSLGSVGLLVLTVVLLTLSPALSLKTVVVEGASRVSAESVREALEGMYGEPLARISNERVSDALAPLTLIQAFRTRIEPPGTLIVSIVERRPLGVVPGVSGYDVVDAAAVTLWSSDTPPGDVPRILVAAKPDSPSFQAISRVLLALPDALLSQVEGVTATTLDDVRFTMRSSSHEVVWGSSDRAAEKARVLIAALDAAGGDSPRTIDVTTPESVVIRLRS